jgi:hypothetical protein
VTLGEPSLAYHIAAGTVLVAIRASVVLAVLGLIGEAVATVGKHFRTGLQVGLLCLLLYLPTVLLAATRVEVSAPSYAPLLQGGTGELAGRAAVVAAAVVVVVALLGVVWHALVYCAAAAQTEDLGAAPPLSIGPVPGTPWRIVAAGLAGGVAAGLTLSFVLTLAGSVPAAPIFGAARVGPFLPEDALALRAAVLVPAAGASALIEELAWRGAVLGWLRRAAGDRRAGVVVAMFGVGLAWALVHSLTAPVPLLRLAALLPVGVALGEVARRYGVPAAVAAHLGLNVVSAAVAAAA